MSARLRKAERYAKELLTLSENHCDARSRLECQAYCSWIEGLLLLTRSFSMNPLVTHQPILWEI